VVPIALDDVGHAANVTDAGGLASAREPFGDDAIVLAPALAGSVLAEVDVLAVERDDGPPAGLVETVRGIDVDETRHSGSSFPLSQRRNYRFGLRNLRRPPYAIYRQELRHPP
jgi:hypothetical protein